MDDLRDECLNVHWFESMEEAEAKIENWRSDYYDSRPHQALGERKPMEFAREARYLDGSMGSRTA